MGRALVVGLTLLHLGPGVAFALLAFGCDGAPPPLGAACGGDVFASFARLTFGAWGVLVLAGLALHRVARARRASPAATGTRVAALLALLACGAALGAAGAGLTGSSAWWLAVPAALAAGWIALANPLACEPAAPAAGAARYGDGDAASPPARK